MKKEPRLTKWRDAKTQNSFLHVSAVQGLAELCTVLLNRDATLSNAVNTSLRTPLHEAAARGHVATVVVLVEKGADTQLRTKDGETAIAIAKVKGQVDVVNYLEYVEQSRRLDALCRQKSAELQRRQSLVDSRKADLAALKATIAQLEHDVALAVVDIESLVGEVEAG